MHAYICVYVSPKYTILYILYNNVFHDKTVWIRVIPPPYHRLKD